MIALLLAILGMFDIIVGFSLLFHDILSFMTFYIGVFVLAKGLMSLIGSLANKYFFDFMGAIDVIAGISLILNFTIPFFWFLPMLKGIYSIFSE